MNMRTTGPWAAAVATAVLVAACSAGGDKAGAETVVLKLATIDRVSNNGQSGGPGWNWSQSYGPQAFVDSLEEASGGGIKLEVTTDYGQGAPDAESDLVEAIASGDVDGGWPSTRAFANAGITGLEAVEAPMMLTSYAAEKALVSGPVADQLLEQLDGTGIVGLDLAVGPLRRPFAAEAPLLGPENWAGATFRVPTHRCKPTRCACLGPRLLIWASGGSTRCGRAPARRGVRHCAVRAHGQVH